MQSHSWGGGGGVVSQVGHQPPQAEVGTAPPSHPSISKASGRTTHPPAQACGARQTSSEVLSLLCTRSPYFTPEGHQQSHRTDL